MSYITETRFSTILRGIIKGTSAIDISKEIGISDTRVGQILHKYIRIVGGEIVFINKSLAKKDSNYIILNNKSNIGNTRNHYNYHKELYLGYSNANSREEFYEFLKNYQKETLSKINEKDTELIRTVLFHQYPSNTAKETGLTDDELLDLTKLVCFKLNPEIRVQPEDQNFNWYRGHKRLFFDQPDLELSNLKYIGLLKFLEKGIKPKAITPMGLEQFFREQYPFIEVECVGSKRVPEDQYRFELHPSSNKTKLVVKLNNYDYNNLLPLDTLDYKTRQFWIGLYLRLFAFVGEDSSINI